MTLTEIMTDLLNDLVEGRVWANATPNTLPRDENDQIKPFIIWSRRGGRDSEYVDQTMPEKLNARVQIQAVAATTIGAETLLNAARDKMIGSAYPVGVYGSPVDTNDAARKLRGQFQQFSIWFSP